MGRISSKLNNYDSLHNSHPKSAFKPSLKRTTTLPQWVKLLREKKKYKSQERFNPSREDIDKAYKAYHVLLKLKASINTDNDNDEVPY